MTNDSSCRLRFEKNRKLKLVRAPPALARGLFISVNCQRKLNAHNEFWHFGRTRAALNEQQFQEFWPVVRNFPNILSG